MCENKSHLEKNRSINKYRNRNKQHRNVKYKMSNE